MCARGDVAQRSIDGFRAAAESTYAVGDRQDEAAVDANDGDPVQAPARSRVENGLGDFEEDFGLARHGETIHCSRSPWGRRERGLPKSIFDPRGNVSSR